MGRVSRYPSGLAGRVGAAVNQAGKWCVALGSIDRRGTHAGGWEEARLDDPLSQKTVDEAQRRRAASLSSAYQAAKPGDHQSSVVRCIDTARSCLFCSCTKDQECSRGQPPPDSSVVHQRAESLSNVHPRRQYTTRRALEMVRGAKYHKAGPPPDLALHRARLSHGPDVSNPRMTDDRGVCASGPVSVNTKLVRFARVTWPIDGRPMWL